MSTIQTWWSTKSTSMRMKKKGNSPVDGNDGGDSLIWGDEGLESVRDDDEGDNVSV